MKSIRSGIAPIVTAALLLGGCAASYHQLESEALLPEIDVVAVKEHSNEALKLAREAKLELDIINTRLAEIDNRLVFLAEEVAGVSIAKIEEIEIRMALLVEAYKDLQARLATVEASPRGGARGSTGKPAAGFSPSTATAVLPTSKEFDRYHAALRLFNGRNYERARAEFAAVQEAWPQGTYAANAQYWSGECYYAMEDYASAIAAFSKVFDFSSSTKADDARFKIGLSHLKLGQHAQAREAFQTVIDRYPASPYVTRARTYLARIQ